MAPKIPQINSCFISYAHSRRSDDPFVKHVRLVFRLLDTLVGRSIDHPLYFDEARLEPAFKWKRDIAIELCRSACMVILFHPVYLYKEYCRRELAVMQQIEGERGVDETKAKGLIIPVLVWGRDEDLPEDLRERQYCDLRGGNLSLGADELDLNPDYCAESGRKLAGIAHYIKDRCEELEANPSSLENCERFPLPPDPGRPAKPAPTVPFASTW